MVAIHPRGGGGEGEWACDVGECAHTTALKLAVKRSPLMSVSLLTLTVLMLMTYLMRVAEGPGTYSSMPICM